MRNFDASDWLSMIIGLIGVAMVIGIVFVAVDMIGGASLQEDVSVIEKHYEPSHILSGTNSRGDFTTQWEGERYILIISRDGETQSRTVSAQEYTKAQAGQIVTLGFRRGWLTGKDW
jgi:hypothetical protein